MKNVTDYLSLAEEKLSNFYDGCRNFLNNYKRHFYIPLTLLLLEGCATSGNFIGLYEAQQKSLKLRYGLVRDYLRVTKSDSLCNELNKLNPSADSARVDEFTRTFVSSLDNRSETRENEYWDMIVNRYDYVLTNFGKSALYTSICDEIVIRGIPPGGWGLTDEICRDEYIHEGPKTEKCDVYELRYNDGYSYYEFQLDEWQAVSPPDKLKGKSKYGAANVELETSTKLAQKLSKGPQVNIYDEGGYTGEIKKISIDKTLIPIPDNDMWSAWFTNAISSGELKSGNLTCRFAVHNSLDSLVACDSIFYHLNKEGDGNWSVWSTNFAVSNSLDSLVACDSIFYHLNKEDSLDPFLTRFYIPPTIDEVPIFIRFYTPLGPGKFNVIESLEFESDDKTHDYKKTIARYRITDIIVPPHPTSNSDIIVGLQHLSSDLSGGIKVCDPKNKKNVISICSSPFTNYKTGDSLELYLAVDRLKLNSGLEVKYFLMPVEKQERKIGRELKEEIKWGEPIADMSELPDTAFPVIRKEMEEKWSKQLKEIMEEGIKPGKIISLGPPDTLRVDNSYMVIKKRISIPHTHNGQNLKNGTYDLYTWVTSFNQNGGDKDYHWASRTLTLKNSD